MKTLILMAALISCGAFAAPLIVTPSELGSVRIEIDIDFDGQTKRFQLDTGANGSMVGPDKQTSTYPSVGKTNLEGAAGLPVECDLIAPTFLTVDILKIQNFQIKRCDLEQHSFHNLGLDVFKGQTFELNFNTNEMFFVDSISQDWNLMPLTRLGYGHLKIDAGLDSLKIGVLFDTGAQLTAVDTLFIENNPQLFKLISRVETGRDITGQPVAMELYELSKIQIGTVTLENIIVVAFDFGKIRGYLGENTPIILGTNAIIQANWFFDLARDQWSVRP